MFYTSITVGGFVYQTLFDEATTIGLKMHYLLTTKTDVPKDWKGKVGYMTKEMVISEVPDYKERTFYLSGPSAMVDAYKELLLTLGVSNSSIITDYFPGF
jgi:ferredoxin-NADP reductase